MGAGVGRHHFVAREVEVAAVGRVRGLLQWHRCVEARPVLLEPREIGSAVATKAMQRLVGDDAVHLSAEIVEHRLWRVLEAGAALVGGAASRVDHAAGQRAGTAAFETIDHDHAGAARSRLYGRAGACGAPADDHDIGALAPLHGLRIVHLQRRLDQRCRIGTGHWATFCPPPARLCVEGRLVPPGGHSHAFTHGRPADRRARARSPAQPCGPPRDTQRSSPAPVSSPRLGTLDP